jgi:hypothetical protein
MAIAFKELVIVRLCRSLIEHVCVIEMGYMQLAIYLLSNQALVLTNDVEAIALPLI